jgi:hypothetical protein
MNGVGERLRRDPNVLVLGGAIALATIIVGTGLAVYVSANPDRNSSSAEAAAAGSTTTSPTGGSGSGATTSTTGGSGSGPAGTLPATGAATPSTAPPTPRETSDPADPPYQAVPLPPGVRATLDSCTWSPANGGELQASGTITWTGPEEDIWDVTVYWLQNERELDWEFTNQSFEMQPGQTFPWRLTVTDHPDPPGDQFRCAVEVD